MEWLYGFLGWLIGRFGCVLVAHFLNGEITLPSCRQIGKQILLYWKQTSLFQLGALWHAILPFYSLVLAAWLFGMGIEGVIAFWFFWCLFNLALIDWYCFSIPHFFIIFGLVFAFLGGFFFLEPIFFLPLGLEIVLHAFVMMGGMYFFKFIIELCFGEEMMGDGDTLILGMFGAFFGLRLACVALGVGCFVALLYGMLKRVRKIAFVPFLFLGGFSVFFVKLLLLFG